MGAERLTDEQIGQIVAAVKAGEAMKAHACRFDEAEAKRVHSLAEALGGEGMENFRAVLEFGGKLRMLSKFGWIAFITVVVGAFLSALWLGFKASLAK